VTYSIVARDPQTGEMGVAVQSHWFAAGASVPWAEAGVGAVATQAFLEMSYGPRGLDLLRAGATASETLARLVADDPDADVRQVGIVDAHGNVATHTGARTIPAAGHTGGDAFSCQANMMWRDTVWGAMAAAYTGSSGALADRFLAALDAAEAERGDLRGRQAAGILIVGAERMDEPWRGVRMHLHVDDHPAPNTELRRLVDVHRSYEHLERSEELELAHDAEGVRREREAALAAGPALLEVKYWAAIGLATEGRHEEAASLMASVNEAGPGWAELLRRLVDHQLMEIPPAAAARLLEDGPG
jgi:uncharacterized Ntn-hydrolase superfamily protein